MALKHCILGRRIQSKGERSGNYSVRGKILMKNSIMLFSDKDIIQIINLFTGNDCHSDRKAVLEEQKINYSEFYVPECTPDGRYQTIQCYKSTGNSYMVGGYHDGVCLNCGRLGCYDM